MTHLPGAVATSFGDLFMRMAWLWAGVVLAGGLEAQVPAPALAADDRVRLAEAFRLMDHVGIPVAPGERDAPEAVLLVAGEHEFLLRHPTPTPDFTSLGADSLLGTTVWVRPRSFPPGLLATFPAVSGVPTIVVGTPGATGKTATTWVLTLLHEHLHQWQYSRAGYYPALAALNLSRGDSTGMWVLEYPFPYDSAPIGRAVKALAGTLASALGEPAARRATWLPAVRVQRDSLLALLGADDRRYLEFQLWQEGVARWSEYAAARAASRSGEPSAPFRALPDYVPYPAQVTRGEEALRRELRDLDLARDRRVVVYPLGAALALLLDAGGPAWRERYAAERFTLTNLLGVD